MGYKTSSTRKLLCVPSQTKRWASEKIEFYSLVVESFLEKRIN